MSGRWLLRGCAYVATFDDDGHEYRDADVLVDGATIVAVGPRLDAAGCDRVVDGSGLVVLPGLVNAHQHLYQGALRAIPQLERALIGPWLRELGAIVKAWWEAGRFEPGAVEAIATAVLTESLLGGVTTVADQHYFHPAGPTRPYVEATIAAAGRVGVRLHACRGTLTLGPDPSVVQTVDEVVRHSEALIVAHHDPAPGARVRVALAPCGVHVDELALFDELAALAADHGGVRLHTHLYEHVDTEAAFERYGRSPWELLVAHGWAQPRTWLAHCADVPRHELAAMADAGVGIAHLVAPDLRMGWGVAPVRDMLDAGIAVGFGTTGSASNDGANLLGDLRLAALVHRTRDGDDPSRWLDARTLLHMATRGGAACLGRDDLGALAAGMQADIAAWDLRRVDRIGVHDPIAGLLLTGLSSAASFVAVGGEVLVEDGAAVTLDVDAIAAGARAAVPPLPG